MNRPPGFGDIKQENKCSKEESIGTGGGTCGSFKSPSFVWLRQRHIKMEVERRIREEQAHPDPKDRYQSRRCDGIKKNLGGDKSVHLSSLLHNTQHPRYQHHQVVRETTNQFAQKESDMFGPEEQLKAFKTEDTLKIVNIRPDGSQYPFESSTTTQDLQQSVFTEDVRLREKAGWAAHTSLVPSLQQLNTQLAELAATGHVVVLPPAGHRNDKLQNHYDDSAGVSVTSTSFQPPPGYVPTRTPPTRGVETRFRLTRSEFADPGGKVEMYNR